MMSEPTPELLARIQADKLQQARGMTPLRRLLAGPELYDAFLERYAIGLRHQHPDADEQEIKAMVLKRVRELQQRDRADEYP